MIELIRQEIERGAVIERQYGPYSLFTYSKRCMFKKLWNDVVVKCRGIVFHGEEIVCRPFNKFFNLEEIQESRVIEIEKRISQGGFEVIPKLDGSMIALWYHDGAWKTSTPGSLESEQAKYSKKVLLPRYNLNKLPQNRTYICELITPWNKIVIDYGDQERLVLLTSFKNMWEINESNDRELDIFSRDSGMFRIVSEDCSDPLNLNIPDGKEGFVIKFPDSFRIKVKSLWYIRRHKLLDYCNAKRIIELIKEKEYEEVIKTVPEHARAGFNDIYSLVLKTKVRIEQDIYFLWEGAPTICFPETQMIHYYKSIAIYIQGLNCGPDIKNILFAKMRGKDCVDLIWKAVSNEVTKKD